MIKTIEDLQPNPSNSNRGTPRGHSIIEHFVRQRGAGRSGLAANDGTMIAGNQTLQKMMELGIPVRPIHTNGKEWVVVIRDDIEPGSEDARLLEIEDNRASELGLSYDPTVFASLKDDLDLSHLFSTDEMAALLEGVGEPPDIGGGGDEFDGTPAVDGPTRTAAGELWLITGNGLTHRLIVGDCTDPAVVERLMGGDKFEMSWMDPPYGVAIGDKNKYLNAIAPSNRVEENLENDTLDEDALLDMLRGAFALAAGYCLAGGAWYVAAPPGPLHVLFGQALKELGVWHQTIQWVKNNATFAPLGVDYHWRAEPIFYGWLPGAAHRYYGGRQQDTVWEIDRPAASPEHPTMKPVELVKRAIENSSRKGEIVYDGFLGSGTTIVAGHRAGRKVYGCEISTRYADVCLARAEAEGLACSLAAGLTCERIP